MSPLREVSVAPPRQPSDLRRWFASSPLTGSTNEKLRCRVGDDWRGLVRSRRGAEARGLSLSRQCYGIGSRTKTGFAVGVLDGVQDAFRDVGLLVVIACVPNAPRIGSRS
jgi:hypothetical protein